MAIKDVSDLKVYNDSLNLLPKLYKFLAKVPISERDTVFQTKRAGKSIPAQITEGFAKRRSIPEFKRYLLISLGSSDEVVTHLKVISIIQPTLQKEALEIANEYRDISRSINSLHKKWNINNY